MIDPKLLDFLRCPLNPSKTRLLLENDHLVCERCALRFPIKDRLPIMVVEEAELPPGCESTSDLPCQRQPAERIEDRGSRIEGSFLRETSGSEIRKSRIEDR